MQAVLFKAVELGYVLRDPREKLEHLIDSKEYLHLTDDGKIDFLNGGYEEVTAIEITLDWFNSQKPVPVIEVTMPVSHLKKLTEEYAPVYGLDTKKWSVGNVSN